MKAPDCMKRFAADFMRKEFAAIKILYFLVFGALFALFPFLTIQARSLGIQETELGIISGVLPLLGVFAPAVAGGVADKIGNFKIFLSATMAISGLSALTYLAVPPARLTHVLPDLLPLDINCTADGNNIQVRHPYTCEYTDIKDASINMTSCVYRCTPERFVQLSFSSVEEPKLCSITENCDSATPNNVTAKPIINENELSTLDDQSSSSPDVAQSMIVAKDNSTQTLLQLKSGTCPDSEAFLKMNTLLYQNGLLDFGGLEQETCWLQCSATVHRAELCSNKQSIEKLDVILTMTIYVIVRVVNSVALVCSLPLFEGATVAILKEYKGDFGFQKLYSNIGQIVWTPISGALIDAFSNGSNVNYAPAFYLYCILKFLCAFVIMFMDLEFKKPAKKLARDLRSLVCNLEVMTFIVVGLVAGAAIGVIDTFLFWLLEDMGAPRSLMGLTVTVGASFGIPMLVFSTPIIKKLGHVNTLTLGFAFYVVRLLGYSFITEPWMAMPFEALECFTTSLFGVAATSYTSELSSPSTVASLQGLFGGLMYGVGRGAGSMISGFMITRIGLRRSFQLSAVACSIVAIVYFVLNFIFFRKNEKERREKNLKNSGNISEDKVAKNVNNGVVTSVDKLDLEKQNFKTSKTSEFKLEDLKKTSNDVKLKLDK